jgi:hypothetical protein
MTKSANAIVPGRGLESSDKRRSYAGLSQLDGRKEGSLGIIDAS